MTEEEFEIVLVCPIVIFSPILAIKATRLSSTEDPFFILDLLSSSRSEFIELFNSLSSFTKLIKSSFLATKSVSQFTSIIDKEQELITEELKNSGKPEEIAKKISLGKMNKFKEENALLTQAWVMEPKKKVQDVLKELSINDLKIKEFSRIKIGE